MKSWSTIPPAKFADQLFKDLDLLVLGDINNGESLFKNLDWIFDFKKLDPKTSFDANDITKFMDELENYTLDPSHWDRLKSKFDIQTKDDLLAIIEDNFDLIISISN